MDSPLPDPSPANAPKAKPAEITPQIAKRVLMMRSRYAEMPADAMERLADLLRCEPTPDALVLTTVGGATTMRAAIKTLLALDFVGSPAEAAIDVVCLERERQLACWHALAVVSPSGLPPLRAAKPRAAKQILGQLARLDADSYRQLEELLALLAG